MAGATPYVLDLNCEESPTESSGNKKKGSGFAVASANPKQIRARARRLNGKVDEYLELLGKPIEEWDDEELARGRPRNKNGTFQGSSPKWVTNAVREEAQKRFGTMVKSEMNHLTTGALEMLKTLMEDDSRDARGRPNVSANVRVDVAKFLLEHIVGKPTQRQESDISVKLQGILGMAIVQPNALGELPSGDNPMASVSHTSTPSFSLPILQGSEIVDAESWSDDD